jgi:hypothetical protein
MGRSTIGARHTKGGIPSRSLLLFLFSLQDTLPNKMGTDGNNKKANNSAPPPARGANNNHQGGWCHNHNCWINVVNTTPKKFKGKTPEIKNDIFNNTGLHDVANFHQFLKNIANYYQLIHRNDVSEGICNLTPVPSHFPPFPSLRLILALVIASCI